VSRFWEVSLRHGCTDTFFQPVMTTLAADPIPAHSYNSWITGLEIPAAEETFGVRIQSSWGMTEVVTSVLINDPAAPSVEGSIGRVSPEYSIRVVSLDTGEDADEGELRVAGVRGLSLFAGYHRNPEATAEGFDERGMWCTGDLVRLLPSGDVQFVSRNKDMLRVGGENVAAAEIERVLMEHPAVSAAGVVGHPDQFRGEVAVGFVVAAGVADDADSLAAFEAEVIAHCTERLAGFKVPRRVHLIAEMPESLIGKMSKKILAEQALALGLGDA
ncbi:AMP-binding enzyme, partial [Ilumatobacter sp.]|uniref:AMP-binding enzyme n=1 Tax=Ilumatobacter sp. TaxID=1967498 RepID=UPI003C3B4293